MNLNLIGSPNPISHGLDALVSELETSGLCSLGLSWQNWFQRAVEQLETDDSIDARLTDELAESLAEAEEAIADGCDSGPALRRLISLYHRNQESKPLELRWREKAASLGTIQLESRTWEDLHKALDASAAGRLAVVSRWIDKVEETFLAIWEGYERSDVLQEEITLESVLGHRLLREGVEGWLEALASFRESLDNFNLKRTAILTQAEAAQRLLMVVQVIEQEAQDSVGRFIAAWSN